MICDQDMIWKVGRKEGRKLEGRKEGRKEVGRKEGKKERRKTNQSRRGLMRLV